MPESPTSDVQLGRHALSLPGNIVRDTQVRSGIVSPQVSDLQSPGFGEHYPVGCGSQSFAVLDPTNLGFRLSARWPTVDGRRRSKHSFDVLRLLAKFFP